jgi:succinate dehydrogenase / fumarate reductase flavoprotein subunit
MRDLLIIGSGGAGLSAALGAHAAGLRVTVVTKTLPTAAQTAMAQGGINAVIRAPDTLQNHIDDTLRSAHGLADALRVEQICRLAPDAIEWLSEMGVPFSTASDSLAQRRLGGAEHPRACHAQDYTGLKILHTLYDRCIAEGIEILDEHFLLDLMTQDHTVFGGVFWDIRRGEVVTLDASHTLVATGGYGEIYHGYTTNTYGATGDGIAAVLRAGGHVSDMEFVQFHPTALSESMVLISEGARGAGAHLITDAGERFVDELAPRDVVARAIFEQTRIGRHVFLDLRPIDPEILHELMPQELHLARIHADIDPLTQPLPILPAVHYTMGGIEVDDAFAIQGLDRAYAIGECANIHLHGANRLGGNSLMEIIVSGQKAIHSITSATPTPVTTHNTAIHHQHQTNRIQSLMTKPLTYNLYFKRKILGKRLYHDLGIVRDAALIADALTYIQELQAKLPQIGIADKTRENNQNLIEYLEFENTLLLSHAVAHSAALRTESRGAHYRSDCPEEDATWARHTRCRIEKGELTCK